MLISKSGAQPASDVCNSTTTNDTLTFYYYDKFDEIFSGFSVLFEGGLGSQEVGVGSRLDWLYVQ